MRRFSIKEWADDDQPRKKLLNKGVDSLSDSELLAILINNGTAERSALLVAQDLLKSVENNLGRLARLSPREMVKQRIKGLGEAKAVNISAALELGVRRAMNGSRKIRISRSTDIVAYLRATLEYRKHEIFSVVFLNQGCRVVHIEHVSQGGLTGTVADPRVILRKALEHEATAIILCHNHPSGNIVPSATDELLTQKIKHAAALLDISVMDHIIVSNEGYFSFADEGRL